MKRKIGRLAIIALTVTVTACGAGTREDEENDDSNNPTNFEEPSNSIAYDDELSQEGASAAMGVALSSMADSHGSTSGSSLALVEASIEDNSTYSRSCEEQDGSAVVTIEADVDRTFTWNGVRRQIERVITGAGDLTRTWSKDEGDMACAETGKYVEIDWTSDLTGVKLDIALDRSRDVALTYEFARRDISYSAERSYTAKGTRTVNWTAHEEDEEEDLITRTKTIESSVARTHARENSRGQERELALDIETDSDAPLTVKVERSSADGSLSSKLLEGGKLIATRDNDARLETTFENVLIEFTDEDCEVVSGEVTYEFYAASSDDESDEEEEAEAEEEAEEEPVKTLKLTIEDGSYTLVDQDSGDIAYEFEFENCQYRDFFRN